MPTADGQDRCHPVLAAIGDRFTDALIPQRLLPERCTTDRRHIDIRTGSVLIDP